MFFKKNKNAKQSDPLRLEFEQDRRSFYRVRPSPQAPLVFRTGEQLYKVIDVGAGGFSFQLQGVVRAGQVLKGLLHLPTHKSGVPVAVEVLSIDEGGMVRSQINAISDQNREHIHYYVLQRQKEELEEKKHAPDN